MPFEWASAAKCEPSNLLASLMERLVFDFADAHTLLYIPWRGYVAIPIVAFEVVESATSMAADTVLVMGSHGESR